MKTVFIDSHALVESKHIGSGTRIWGFTHIHSKVKIGKNCNIGEQCYVENGVEIADGVTIKNGVSLWKGIKIENDVFIGPSAAFTNDAFPRSRNRNFKLLTTIIKKSASIGANATILPGLTIGPFSMVGAGAVVVSDIGNYWIVAGNPAKVIGYLCECGRKLTFTSSISSCRCKRKFKKENNQIKKI